MTPKPDPSRATAGPPEHRPRLPYFDVLMDLLDAGERRVEVAFGRHVHWGYWPDPSRATLEAEDFGAAAERLSAEVYTAANVADGQTVLDVGCGFGGTIASLNERFRDLTLIGINIEPRQIARARAKATRRAGNRVAFVGGTASHLPIADASCDAVLSVEAIFHFPDRAQFFREAHRVLKPGGRLALSDFVPQTWMLPGLWPKIPSFHFGDCDVRYGLRRYRRLAQETGLRPVLERNINANTLPTYDFLETLKPLIATYGIQVVIETRVLAWLSRLRVLRYSILAFEKPEIATAP